MISLAKYTELFAWWERACYQDPVALAYVLRLALDDATAEASWSYQHLLDLSAE